MVGFSCSARRVRAFENAPELSIVVLRSDIALFNAGVSCEMSSSLR